MRGTRFTRGAFLLYLLIGCGQEDCNLAFSSGLSGGSSNGGGCAGPSGASGCQYGAAPNGSLGQGDFAYVCPSAAGTDQDAWCDLRGAVTEPPDASDAAVADAMADLQALRALDGGPALLLSLEATMPDVAVGAAFQLSYTPVAAVHGLTAPAPVLAALVEKVPRGTALAANEWAGYVVWQGSNVFDYTHVHARPVASLRLELAPEPSGALLGVGSTMTIGALPLALDGKLLAGAMGCSFDSSDPSVASVSGSGRVARLVSIGPGETTVTVSCLGSVAQTILRFGSSSDAGDDGTADGSPSDASNASEGNVSEGGDDGPASADAAADAGADASESDAGEGG